jgi:hypothetical protein
MKHSPTVIVLALLSSAGFCDEGAGPSAQELRFVVDIRCPSALTYQGNGGQVIGEYTKPAITLYRIDAKGAKVKVLTLSGDAGVSETPAVGAAMARLTLKGNVRGESPDGAVVRADAAELDLVAGTFTYKGRLGTAPQEK